MAFLAAIPALIGALGAGAGAAGAIGTGIAGAAAGVGTAAAAASPWLAYAGLGLSALGGVTGAVGAVQQGQAQASAAEYNAQLSNRNAAVAKENANIAGQAGSEQAYIQSQKTRAEVGSIKASQAASGIDVNSGSALDVRTSARELGELDALTVRSNATKEAYGYVNQAANFKSQANLDEFEAKNDKTASYISGASTLLGAAASGADQFYKYQLQGGFSG